MSSSIKNALSPETRRNLRHLRLKLLSLKESALWGGTRRESALVRLLNRYYFSLYRRQWELSDEEPHFFSQRIGFFKFAFGDDGLGPYAFYRGFFGSEVIQPDDQLLDIGCDDGFFTKRFLSSRCAKVDAVDIEPSAIESAQIFNSAPNISYRLLDAVNEPFPSEKYDVIVWDGAIGHFAKETTDRVLAKIQAALETNGVFVGSESLGFEGSDHLRSSSIRLTTCTLSSNHISNSSSCGPSTIGPDRVSRHLCARKHFGAARTKRNVSENAVGSLTLRPNPSKT
jgi:2-polyprenyl-3-methyl-5-hydroxy-6-metoxy-1,4-benzoquinol methylase